MNGHQVNFFLTPKDLAECESRIREVGPLVLIEYRSDNRTPRTLSNTVIAEMGKTWLSIGLTRPEDLDAIRLNSVKSQDYFIMDILRSPAVELSRCFYDGMELRRGRLYYTSEFYDEKNNFVRKNALFVKWAKSILNTAISGLRKDSQLQSYIGTQAEQFRRDGKCLFVV